MATTYHSGRRIQGLSTDTVETLTYGTTFSGSASHTTDNTTVQGWLASDADKLGVNGTTNMLDWDQERGSNDAISYDLGSGVVDSSEWVLRYKIRWDSFSNSNYNEQRIGLSNLDSTNDHKAIGTGHNFLGTFFYYKDNSPRTFFGIYGQGVEIPTETTKAGWTEGSYDNEGSPTDTWRYIEVKRTSTITFEVSMSSTDEYTKDVYDSGTNYECDNITGLRYLYMCNEVGGSAGDDANMNCNIGDIKFYNGTTTVTDSKPINISTTEIYNESTGASSLDLYTAQPRLGVKAVSGATTGHINKIKVWLRVIGTHTPTNPVYARVRKISDGTIVASSTPKPISELTGVTTITEYEFDFGSCVEIKPTQHYILIEYPYGDSSNYLGLSRHDSAVTGWEWIEYDGSTYDATDDQALRGSFSSQVGHVCKSIQTGSRFEETDTRKIYHFADNGITGSDVSSSELKAYYKFDESSGNIVNVANTITGNSTLGTGQNITMNGDPTYSVTGTPSSFGNAVSCDGSGDYGQFGTKTDWNFLHTTGATWTINVWLKFDASVVTNKTLFDNTQAADSTIGLNIRTQSSNRFRVIIPRGVGNSSTLDTDNNPNLPIPTDNAWHMYTIRWDQSSGNGVLTYKTDGANEVTKNGSGNGTTTSDCTDSPRLFSESDAVSGELDAEIAEMSIWNRILTTAEETALYNSGSGKIIAQAWREEGT